MQPTAETFPLAWDGEWNVWIANPKISIVNRVNFVVIDNSVRSTWYEGTRQVILEGIVNVDGTTITGVFWNSDVESLSVNLTLDPSGSFFTGIADSDTGAGQFCGTRTDPKRPDPCRTESP